MRQSVTKIEEIPTIVTTCDICGTEILLGDESFECYEKQPTSQISGPAFFLGYFMKKPTYVNFDLHKDCLIRYLKSTL